MLGPACPAGSGPSERLAHVCPAPPEAPVGQSEPAPHLPLPVTEIEALVPAASTIPVGEKRSLPRSSVNVRVTGEAAAACADRCLTSFTVFDAVVGLPPVGVNVIATVTLALPVDARREAALPFALTVNRTVPFAFTFTVCSLTFFPDSFNVPGPGTVAASVAVPLPALALTLPRPSEEAGAPAPRLPPGLPPPDPLPVPEPVVPVPEPVEPEPPGVSPPLERGTKPATGHDPTAPVLESGIGGAPA